MRPILASLSLLMACPAAAPPGPTWHQDVLPIVERHCLRCHSGGGIGTFVMDDPLSAVLYSGSIRREVEARRMPPYPMRGDGSCQDFQDAAWLSQEEIDTIAHWVDAGAPLGEDEGPAQIPAPPVLEGEDLIDVALPPGYVPMPNDVTGSPTDDYQCFLGTIDALRGRFITGYEVLPEQATQLHHVVGFLVDPTENVGEGYTNEEVMTYLDGLSPEQPGWDCDGSAGEYVRARSSPIQWAPGQGAVSFPEGVGIEVGPTDVLVLQVHYTTALGSAPDSSIVRLRASDAVSRRAWFDLQDEFLGTLYGSDPAVLPAGDPAATFAWSSRVEDFFPGVALPADLEVLAVLPHMHRRGRLLNLDFEVDDEPVCGGRVDRWDFNWQFAYWYADPIAIGPSDRVQVECTWDTTGDENDVAPGFSTAQEMCLVGLFVVER